MAETREALLEALDVKKYFPVTGLFGKVEAQVKAVDGVSLSIRPGETYGLVGETGCGKSTLGRVLAALTPPSAGSVRYRGRTLEQAAPAELRALRRSVQMIFQDPYTSLDPRRRIGDVLTETLAIHRIGTRSSRVDTAAEMLEKVGLPLEHYYRFPHELSGGQRQRVGIARALILEPELVVCDEPVSALDVSVRSQIINLLLDLQKERRLSYLFISHDMSVIRYTSDRTGVMYLGHLVEEADTAALFASPRHPYTRMLLSAVPVPDPHRRHVRVLPEGDLPSPMCPPSGCVFHTRCPHACRRCAEETPLLRPVGEGHQAACHLCGEA